MDGPYSGGLLFKSIHEPHALDHLGQQVRSVQRSLCARARSADNAANNKEETQTNLLIHVVFIVQSPFKIAAATRMVAIDGSFRCLKLQGTIPSRARKEAEANP